MFQSLIWFFIVFIGPFIEEELITNDYGDPVSLIEYCRIIETPNKLTPEQVERLFSDQNTPLAPQSETQGFSQNYFWISFNLKDFKEQESLLIELDNPHIDHVLLYQRNSKWDLVGYGGDRNREFNQRSLLNRRYVFPVSGLNTGDEFLLMIDKRNAAVSFPLKLWNKNSFEHFDTRQNVIFGIYFGMLIILSFIALGLGIVLGKKFLWLYGIYATAMILYMFTALGFSFQFLYPSFGSLNNSMRSALIVIVAVFFTYFTREYLSLDRSKPKISSIIKGLNTLIISLFAFGILYYNFYSSNVSVLLNLLYCLLLLIFICSILAGIVSLRTVKKKAIIYLSAFSAVFIGSGLYLMIEYGLLEESDFFMNPVLIGSGIELLIFSSSMIFWSKNTIVNVNNNHPSSPSDQSLESEYEPILELKSQINYIQEKGGKGKGIAGQKDQFFVKINDITHISSQGHYLLIYTKQADKPIIERMTFNEISTKLPESFVRTHRSFIINCRFVTKYTSTNIWLNYSLKVPLSRTYKAQFFEFMPELRAE